MYLWFPFDYANLANNKLKDPLPSKSAVNTNANSGVTNNQFNLPLYNYSETIDFLANAGPDPGTYYLSVTNAVSSNNKQGTIYSFTS